MAFLNKFYSFALPFVLVFSIPLAVFAAVTSTFAISVLLFRALLIYAELAVAVVPYYLRGFGHEKAIKRPSIGHFSSHSPGARRRKRRSSGSSAASGALTPVASDANFGLMHHSNMSNRPQRDFEGIGGWRLDPPGEDDALWASINSRLELPAEHVRRHRASLTNGSYYTSPRSYSPEKERMTGLATMEPNTSKIRTPLEGASRERDSDAYFASDLQSTASKGAKRAQSSGTTTSGSSVSSRRLA